MKKDLTNFFNNFSKQDKTFAVFAVLINLFLVSLVVYYGFAAWRLIEPASPAVTQVSFSGEGKVSAKPDIARVVFTIVSDGEALLKVQEENSFRSNRVVEFLKKSGVGSGDIKTLAYNIYPQYSSSRPCPLGGPCPDSEKRPKILGYQIRNTFEIKIRALEKAGDMIGGVVAAGANEVGNLEFSIDNEEMLKEEARRIAISDAKKKADVLAKQLGVKLGRIVSFSESGLFAPVFFKTEAFGGGAAISSPPVQAGENEIRANVSITYELR